MNLRDGTYSGIVVLGVLQVTTSASLTTGHNNNYPLTTSRTILKEEQRAICFISSVEKHLEF